MLYFACGNKQHKQHIHLNIFTIHLSKQQLFIPVKVALIDHMQLRAYLIRNRAPHVINSHVHQAVAILSGKKNKVMRQSYVLLVVRHDFNICINRQLLEEAGVQFLWNVNVHG